MKLKTYNIALLDDMDEDRMIICGKIRSCFDKLDIPYRINMFSSGKEAFQACESGKYDFLFCDIELREENDGIQFTRRLKSLGNNLIVIFITAFPDYLFKAYEAEHVYLVMKSRLDELLPKAVSRALEVYHERIRGNYIQIRTKGGFIYIEASSVIYVEKQLRQMIFHTDSREIPVYGKFEDFLDDTRFPELVRCHRSYVVNIHKITKAASAELIMISEDRIPLSRTYKNEIFTKIL